MALFHVFSDVENSNTGVPMRGVQVVARYAGSPAVAPIYRDSTGTLFSPPNYCITDSTGMYSFYIEPGTYDLDFKVGAEVIRTIKDYKPAEVGPAGPANNTYTTTDGLENSDTSNVSAILSEVGKAGTFTIRNYADFIAEVAADVGKLNYIRSVSDSTKVWVRASILPTGAALTGIAGGGTVQDRFNSLSSVQGSSLVGFIQEGAAASPRTSQDKNREQMSALDFGAICDGTLHPVSEWIIPGARGRFASLSALQIAYPHVTSLTDSIDWAASQAMINALSASSDYRGGIGHFTKGVYRLNRTLECAPYAPGLVYNITLTGEGRQSTVLDFTGTTGGAHGITAVGAGAGFYISELSVQNASGRGIVMRGGDLGTNGFMHSCGLSGVRIQGCGTGGFYTENSFFLSLSNVWCTSNYGPGVQFAGYHTTIKAQNCWSYQNAGNVGWRVNGVINSSFDNCYGEYGLFGWLVTNCVATEFKTCGAENNDRDGWAFQTGDAFAAGVPAECQDINVTMTGCLALQNSKAGANLWANWISALTANSRPISITLGGGNVSALGTSTTYDLVLTATSGAIDIWGYTTTGKKLASSNQLSPGATLH